MATSLAELWQIIADKVVSFWPNIFGTIVIILISWILIRLLVKAVEHFFHKVDFDRGMETFIENGIRVVLWTVVLIIILANLGVDVGALVAGLGIMGFVVGFALKDTLGNLASGFFILFYKPFKVGDWVRIGGVVGGCEKVGIAACEFKSPDNIKITIPNSKIWGDVIENFSGFKTRKLFNLDIGISYGSDIDKAMKIIHQILKKDKRVLKNPAPQVVVKELADSSVNIGVRPAVKREDFWSLYFDLNKTIKQTFDKEGIEIPFPQRDVWLKEPQKTKKNRSRK